MRLTTLMAIGAFIMSPVAALSQTTGDASSRLEGTVTPYPNGPACADNYYRNTRPDLHGPVEQVVERCHPNVVPGYNTPWSFSDMVFKGTGGPIMSAERLTATNLALSHGISRKGITFRVDPVLYLPDFPGQLSDYRGSGYDRGHLANWEDTANPDSFELSNIIPQDPNSNRHLWRLIEETVRNNVIDDRAGANGNPEIPTYVITGGIYDSNPPTLKGEGHIKVPSYLFKCILEDRKNGWRGCYLAPNGPGDLYEKTSFHRIRLLSGIDLFPADHEDDDVVSLPDPEDGHSALQSVEKLDYVEVGPYASDDRQGE